MIKRKRRVAEAERLWAAGDWSGAFRVYLALLRDIVLERNEIRQFDYNDFLVADRLADLAVQTGYIRPALDLYHALHLKAGDPEIRALASFKRLQIAVEAGDSEAARDVFRWICDELWSGRLLDPLQPETLIRWEATIAWREQSTLLAQMYLSLGKLYNATRKLPEAKQWLENGLRHAKGESRARLAAIPLHLALANQALTCGALTECDDRLSTAGLAVAAHDLGTTYSIWLAGIAAKLALTRGRLAEAAERLATIETECQVRGLARTLCNCLIARAEMFILLNLPDEADECLNKAEFLARTRGLEEIRSDAARVRFFQVSRARLFEDLMAGESAGRMQSDGEPDPLSRTETALLRDDAVIWTGDCLRDYELREALVYAALDAASRTPGNTVASRRADEELSALRQDFEGLPSPLITARLHFLSGLICDLGLRQDTAREELQQAFDMFEQIGAERELYQTALHLAWSVEHTDHQRYGALLEENDRRLNRLSQGMSGEERNAFELNKYRLAEDLRRVRIEEILASRRAATAGPWWRRIGGRLRYWSLLHDFIAELDIEQLKRRTHYRGSFPRSGLASMLRRIAFHSSNNQTVGYLTLPDRTFAYSIRRWHLDCRHLHAGRLSIAKGVKAFHRALSDYSLAEAFPGRAHALCKALGLEDLLRRTPRRIESLTFLPAAELDLIPFASLRYAGHQGTASYLVERFAVNVDDISSRRAAPRGDGAEGVAAYYLGGHDGEALLDGARSATTEAAAWFRKRGKLKCEVVDSKDACLKGLPGAAGFYYFGHGYLTEGDAARTGIGFPGAPKPAVLSLLDLDHLDFSGLRQAILFACYSGDARAFNGRWVVSIPKMLLGRGAQSVLASVWEASQEQSQQVSNLFLRRAPVVGRARAVQEYQVACLNRPDLWNAPFYWAPFQVFGDPGQMRFTGTKRVWKKLLTSTFSSAVSNRNSKQSAPTFGAS